MNTRAAFFTGVAFLLVLPIVALAQRAADGGLVPCGDGDEDGLASACQMCHFVDLANNLGAWLVGVLSIAAAIMFVIAGYRIVTAGGNPSVLKDAKSMIINVAIGFIIVLAAWILIDTLMRALLLDGSTQLGPWRSIECVPQPTYEGLPDRIGLAGAGGGQTSAVCDPGPSGNTICTAQEASCRAQGGTPTRNTSNPTRHTIECALPASSFGGGSCDVVADTSNACHPSNLGCFGASQANAASRICNLESAGGQTGVMSGSDLCRDGNSFSGGLWQVNIIAHCGRIPGCDCSAIRNIGSGAQGGCMPGARVTNSRGVSYCERWNCEVSNQAAYQACVGSVRNPSVNSQIACDLYDGRGGNGNFRDWLTSARACGVMN